MVLEEYHAFVARVDRLVAPLFQTYRKWLQCRKGCYFCCTRISVLPVEHFSVRRWLFDRRGTTGLDHAPPGASAGTSDAGPRRIEEIEAPSIDRSRIGLHKGVEGGVVCPLLGDDGACKVYEARPVICRVHGLPLAYPVFEYDQEGNLLPDSDPMDLWCDLNFRGLDDAEAAELFNADGRVSMAPLQRRLEEISRRFLATEEGAVYGDFEMVDLDGFA
mgnify:CR=1 FL=1